MKNYVGIEGGKVRRNECSLHGNEFENVSPVLLEFLAYT